MQLEYLKSFVSLDFVAWFSPSAVEEISSIEKMKN